MLAVFATILAMMLGSALSVYGCTFGRASTCERFNFYTTIFVGKAIGVEKSNKGSFKTETTLFEVKEVLSGENAESIRVQNKSGFSCDAEFTIGEIYLVFAGGDKKSGFGTGFCEGNLPFEFAGEQILELRRLSRSGAEGRVAGTVLAESANRMREERAPVKRRFFDQTDPRGKIHAQH